MCLNIHIYLNINIMKSVFVLYLSEFGFVLNFFLNFVWTVLCYVFGNNNKCATFNGRYDIDLHFAHNGKFCPTRTPFNLLRTRPHTDAFNPNLFATKSISCCSFKYFLINYVIRLSLYLIEIISITLEYTLPTYMTHLRSNRKIVLLRKHVHITSIPKQNMCDTQMESTTHFGHGRTVNAERRTISQRSLGWHQPLFGNHLTNN